MCINWITYRKPTGIMLEVQVISRKIIKPFFPTPDHLQYYQFSFLDQISSPKMYISLILFFEFNGKAQPNITEISKHLKKSLAEVLALFYPLAGRVHDNLHVDCSDQGVPFLEAHVKNCKLSDILANPIPDELPKLVPFELDDSEHKIPLGVQLNVFECGGFAIGQCISHKVSDGLSMLMFTKAWAATARRALGDHQAVIHRPEFISAILFPPKLLAETSVGLAKNKMTKRFVFDASNIEHLREKYVEGERPTRIETLTAFIWSRLVAVTKDNGIPDHKKSHIVSHVVNLRRKFDPPLSPRTYGNVISLADSTPSLLNTKEECYGLAKQVREAVRKIDKSYIKKLQQGHDVHRTSDGSSITSLFSSLCHFPLYDNDFGWGRPSWVSMGIPGLEFDNVVVFFDTKDGDGIEATISSTDEVLSKLESDNEFLKRLRSSWVSSSLSLTPKAITTANIHTRNQSSMIKKPSAQTKPLRWGSGSVKLFGLALKVFRKR
ncbi:stemmadenine O-acetyltransferase-like [Argentina anserina]|uniref:stemmadenine O-acetyltransferase-like n=1 Tax=Argentina anserina TaxID=57926 RepID=UPI0021765A2F|nr:stemmadenine O-acetyltransferase-like [Potentilla anserina]